MPSKLKAWLKAKLGFGGSSIPYKEFKDEHASTTEEVKVEPMTYYNCDHCGYRSSTQKGLRSHLLTCHKIGVGTGRTLDACGHVRGRSSSHPYTIDAVWTQNLANQKLLLPQICHISIYFNNMSRQWLFGPHVWSYLPLPGHHQVYLQHCTSVAVWTTDLVISATAWTPSMYLQHCTSVAVWTTSLVISATAWTPSSVFPALQFSVCLDYKFGHISHCVDTIKCMSSAELQWLFGQQVCSYQPLPELH
ncbi:uncharacterized protein TNCT_1641 [Trichonephila clavata]|uniref:C2H2-type domain-containing protein n=1 Tax=Trichonephila clavata TaxID=2740835 RepID=A0A8X6GRF0_TRICU|nr:uncharacterized protein TNCT_1641 [Trichonephila clavata]